MIADEDSSSESLLQPDAIAETYYQLHRQPAAHGPTSLTSDHPVKNSNPTIAGSTEPAKPKTRDGLLLVSLVVIWAVSWSVIKIGVGQVPPIWYGCLRYTIAAIILFGLVAMKGELAPPPRSDLSLVVVSGVLQMAAYSALTGLALTILPLGRVPSGVKARGANDSRSWSIFGELNQTPHPVID
jgi:hypothetical protein